jgi:hypothetical protein
LRDELKISLEIVAGGGGTDVKMEIDFFFRNIYVKPLIIRAGRAKLLIS